MRIVNRTTYRTPDLRAIIERVAREELNPDDARRARVVITYAGARIGCHGEAVLGGRDVTVWIPQPPDPASFALVVAHEFAHLRGNTHAMMRGSPRYDWRSATPWRDRYTWAAAMPIIRRPVRPVRPRPPAPDPRVVRRDHAAAMVRAWTTRSRRAATGLARWRRRYAAAARAVDGNGTRGDPGAQRAAGAAAGAV